MKHDRTLVQLSVPAFAAASVAMLLAAVSLASPTTNLFKQIIPAASAQDSLHISPSGSIGMGTNNPARQLHMVGPNAIVRMDRSSDAATFMMVRTDPTGSDVWKTFSVGTRSSGPNVGEFVIQDFGNATSGASERRMTITNDGEAHFTGTVRAPSVVQTSSARFKDEVETLSAAGEAIQLLRGVRFAWKDSGLASLGLIAEEVQAVFPELVETDDGIAAGINYSGLVAVLVEAVKEQQTEAAAYRAEVAQQRARIAQLEERLQSYETMNVRLGEIERLLEKPSLLQTLATNE